MFIQRYLKSNGERLSFSLRNTFHLSYTLLVEGKEKELETLTGNNVTKTRPISNTFH